MISSGVVFIYCAVTPPLYNLDHPVYLNITTLLHKLCFFIAKILFLNMDLTFYDDYFLLKYHFIEHLYLRMQGSIARTLYVCLQAKRWQNFMIQTEMPRPKIVKHVLNVTTVDSHCFEFGWLEFPVESNFYRSPELRCV